MIRTSASTGILARLPNGFATLKLFAGSTMGVELPKDFKEFLSLLRSHGVRYLLIGGYAVSYHGYPRATGDLDIWIAMEPQNADRIVDALREFGFDTPQLSPTLFLQDRSMVRLGNVPLRIEITTAISDDVLDGVEVSLINLAHLKANKRASGRHKDLMDLEQLP
ncbi:MAG TPA: hypothetical protein VFS20_23595 [Longimicrobium sp.]|nr:hypothetical protein [Longimicrobium sp.]